MANLPFLELHVSDVVDRYDDQLHLPCGLQSFRKAAADGVCLFAQLRPDFWHLSQWEGRERALLGQVVIADM